MEAVRPQRNRRRYGWVELHKKTSPQTWKGRWADWSQARIDNRGRSRPKQRSIVLGYKTKDDLPTKTAAQAKWDQIRESVMNPPQAQATREWTFADFVWKRYVPDRSALRSWRPATREKFDFLMSKMEPAFGAQLLPTITTSQMQKLLVRLAQQECEDTVKGIRNYLRAIFREAREERILEWDPARKLILPQTRKPSRPYLSAEQLQTLEPQLDWRDQVILRLFTRCGLRAGEVFGLQPESIGEDRTLFIRQTFSRGRLGPTKTEGSAKKIAIPESLYEELLVLGKEALENGSPWLFPASRKGRSGVLNPLSSENWLKRILKPIAARLGFNVDLRMFRRGFATIADVAGGSLKDIQHQLRHASVTTTANIYVQPVPSSVREVVEKVDRALRCDPKPVNAVSALMTPVRHPRANEEEFGSALESWWARRDSNPRPPACEAGALTN